MSFRTVEACENAPREKRAKIYQQRSTPSDHTKGGVGSGVGGGRSGREANVSGAATQADSGGRHGREGGVAGVAEGKAGVEDDLLYKSPHGPGKKPSWPTEAQMEKLREVCMYVCLFML